MASSPRADRVPWSREEVEATVADYFRMLRLELAGQPYNKAAHNRALLALLNDRSRAAVELKHQNISAVLLELNQVYIPGYKPRGNYQLLLRDVVIEQLCADQEFDRAALQAVERDAVVPDIAELRGIIVEPPVVREVRSPGPDVDDYVPRQAVRRDYLAIEARNRSLAG